MDHIHTGDTLIDDALGAVYRMSTRVVAQGIADLVVEMVENCLAAIDHFGHAPCCRWPSTRPGRRVRASRSS